MGGSWLKWVLTVPGVLFAGLPGALAAQVATTRLLFSMARDARLPKTLAHVSATHQVPDRAALLVSTVTLTLGVLLADRLELLTSMVNFGALSGFLLLHVSVVAHTLKTQRPPPLPTGARQRWRPIASAAVGFLIIGYVIVNLNGTAKLVGFAWLAVGADAARPHPASRQPVGAISGTRPTPPAGERVAADPRQFPSNLGGRLSTNAWAARAWSSVIMVRTMCSASRSITWARLASSAALRFRFM